MSETGKTLDAFRTISEVAEELDLPQHVLRFWETRFPQIKPVKRAGGRRFYRPDDVDLLRGIRQLLYSDGFTIKGVQKILKDQGIRFVQDVGVERAAAVMRSDVPPPPHLAPAPQDGMTFGGLLGLLPRRRPKTREDDALPALPKAVELPLPFPDAEADRDLADHPDGPPAPFARRNRMPEERLEPRLAAPDGRAEEPGHFQDHRLARRETLHPEPRFASPGDPRPTPAPEPSVHGHAAQGASPRGGPRHDPRSYDEPSYDGLWDDEPPLDRRRQDPSPHDPLSHDPSPYDAPSHEPPRYAVPPALQGGRDPRGVDRGFPPADPQGLPYDPRDEDAFGPARSQPNRQAQNWPPERPAADYRAAPSRGGPAAGSDAPARMDPSFAPPDNPVRRAPVIPQRPSRGPAANLSHHAPAGDLDDPLLPFMDSAAIGDGRPDLGSVSESIEERIRRLKAQAPLHAPSPPFSSPPSGRPMAPPQRRAHDGLAEGSDPDFEASDDRRLGQDAGWNAGRYPAAGQPPHGDESWSARADRSRDQADAAYFDPAPAARRAPPGAGYPAGGPEAGGRFVSQPDFAGGWQDEDDAAVFAPLARGRYADTGMPDSASARQPSDHGGRFAVPQRPPESHAARLNAFAPAPPAAAGFYGIPRVTAGVNARPTEPALQAGATRDAGSPSDFPAIVRRQGPEVIARQPVPAGAELPQERPQDHQETPAMSRMPPEPLRHGPPDQYLPPHLRAEPRLSGQPPVAAPVLSRDDVHRLQAALYELGECRRLVDEALGCGLEAASEVGPG